ncbi:Ig domain-containing protein, partial [Streptomyces sp. NPDC052109]|uniref:Ig domain-containing protein n=1 Tax=Streptomyces sp. NPDC052109 TaxID=3155527 RepID=UPI00342BEF7A
MEIGGGARAEADLAHDEVAVLRRDPCVDPGGGVLVVQHLRRGYGGEGLVGRLPTGLSINSSSGLISGTASTAGTYQVTVTATDSTGA